MKKHTKDAHHEPPKAVSIHQNVDHTEIAFVSRFLSEKAKLDCDENTVALAEDLKEVVAMEHT